MTAFRKAQNPRVRTLHLMAAALKPETLVAVICDLEDDGYGGEDADDELVGMAQDAFNEQLSTLVGEAEASRMIESYEQTAIHKSQREIAKQIAER